MLGLSWLFRLNAAPPSIERDQPSTWAGPIATEDEGIVLMRRGRPSRLPAGMIHGTATINQSGFSWRCRTAGAEQCMLDMLPNALWEVGLVTALRTAFPRPFASIS